MEIEIATAQECLGVEGLNSDEALITGEKVNTCATEMLPEHVYNNETSNVELAPESNADENTILLPVAGENGFNNDDPTMPEFLQEEEDVIDPMATSFIASEDVSPISKNETEKPITQVPKKRRNAMPLKFEPEEESPERKLKRRGRKPGTKVINGQVIQPEGEQSTKLISLSIKVSPKPIPTSTSKSTKSGKTLQVKDDQCRICSSVTGLANVFKKEYKMSYAEKIKALCPKVSIQRKDFLPQYLCAICVSSVNAAYALKLQCEKKDAELRSRLDFAIKDLKIPVQTKHEPPDSDPDDMPDPPNDVDFKLSDASPPSAEDSDSEYGVPLAKRRLRRTAKKSPKLDAAKVKPETSSKFKLKTEKKTPSPLKKVIKVDPDHIKPDPDLNTSKTSELDGELADFSCGSEEDYSPPKKKGGKKRSKSTEKPSLVCSVCNETLPSRQELKDHKKAMHSSYECELCSRKFKLQSSLKHHMDKHTQTGILKCEPCDKHFPNKSERRKHMLEFHKDSSAQYTCEKCKRAFTSVVRLMKHNETNCPGFDTSQKRRGDLDSISMGKDLFKCVAPLTTTYWSDSFSD